MEKSLYNGAHPLKRLKLPAKATIYYTLSAALAKSVGILTTPIFTRILSGEEYGIYTLYMSWLGLFTLICSSIISPTSIYKTFEKFNKEKDETAVTAFFLGIGFTLTICILLFAFSPFLGLEIGLFIILSIQILCDESVGLYQSIRRYEYKYRSLSLVNAASVIITPFLSIVLISGARLGYRGRIFGLLITSVIIAIPHISRLLNIGVGKFKKSIAKYIAKRTLPLLPYSASSALSAELDKLMITALLGAEALAKYSVAHTLGLGLGFAVTALASALYPWVIRRLSTEKENEVEPTFSAILCALGALAIVIGAFTPEIFRFLAPLNYAEAENATLPLLLSTLPSFAASFITVGTVNAEKSGYTFFSAVASVISSVVLNLLLIPRLKYFGAGLSLLASSILGLIISYIFLKKCGPCKIFSYREFIKVFLMTLLGLSLCALTYPFIPFRILLLSLPISMLFKAFCTLRGKILES